MLYSHTMRLIVAILAAVLPLAASGDPERNKALARKFYEEAWIKGNAAYARVAFAPRYKVFDPRGRMGVEESAETQEKIARQWCVENGDCSRSEILWQVAEGDRVATYWMFRQTPKRPFAGAIAHLFGRVPLEKPIINVFRFAGDRIIESTNQRDDLGIYFDLGIVNAALVFVFALGGGAGIVLVWIINKAVRRT